MADAQYEVFEGKDEQSYWRLRAANGEVVAQSEGYTRREDAVKGAQTAAEVSLDAVKRSVDFPTMPVWNSEPDDAI